MKNQILADINFKEIVCYDKQPVPAWRYPKQINCDGYCIKCEELGFLEHPARLDLMSHGCDTSDFESVLGELPVYENTVKSPVMFLLENPGGDYKNGAQVFYKNFRKQPPVNHYYWMPNDIDKWPESFSDFIGNWNFYGPYFAYLMRKHLIKNAYITNLTKCKIVSGSSKSSSLATKNCIDSIFSKELKEFSPKVVFAFGGASFRGFNRLCNTSSCRLIELKHPSYIKKKWHLSGKTQIELLDENDKKIAAGLKGVL